MTGLPVPDELQESEVEVYVHRKQENGNNEVQNNDDEYTEDTGRENLRLTFDPY